MNPESHTYMYNVDEPAVHCKDAQINEQLLPLYVSVSLAQYM